MTGVGAVATVVVDCHDPGRLAAFWSGLLGVPREDAGDGWADLGPLSAGGPRLSFVSVPEPKAVKNRLHLDVGVPDLDAATARVERLGAAAVSEVYDGTHPWRVFADPEGSTPVVLLRNRSHPEAEPEVPAGAAGPARG